MTAAETEVAALWAAMWATDEAHRAAPESDALAKAAEEAQSAWAWSVATALVRRQS